MEAEINSPYQQVTNSLVESDTMDMVEADTMDRAVEHTVNVDAVVTIVVEDMALLLRRHQHNTAPFLQQVVKLLHSLVEVSQYHQFQSNVSIIGTTATLVVLTLRMGTRL